MYHIWSNFLDSVENNVVEGEYSHNQHFLLFPQFQQSFEKAFFPGSCKIWAQNENNCR